MYLRGDRVTAAMSDNIVLLVFIIFLSNTVANSLLVNQRQYVDGHWGQWSNWQSCSRSCGIGVTRRTRICNDPAPSGGGRDCLGDSVSFQSCNVGYCPIDGGWSSFVDRPCSVTCGVGVVISVRTCTNPAPQHGGKNCDGSNTAVAGCVQPVCVIDGQWGAWSDLTSCKVICGDGIRYRSRECDSPSPARGGKDCVGNVLDMTPCTNGACPPDFHICDKMKLLTAFAMSSSTNNPCVSDSPDVVVTYCNAPPDPTHWQLGFTKIIEECVRLPLYSPVGMLNATTKQKRYGVLTACFVDSMEIAFTTCTNQIDRRTVKLNDPDSDFRLLHW